jgi:MoxR-like ATPase
MEMARGIKEDDTARVEEMGSKRAELLSEIKKVIVGQEHPIEEILITLFCRGHALLVGVPGLAKTLLVSTLAEVMDLKFNRIQFTPDLMPSDITGTDILEEEAGSRRRQFQAMQEYKVTASGVTHSLEPPFFVLATQNPIEQEGTYPLPEAQLDRFMCNVGIDYPAFAQEVEIVARTTSSSISEFKKVLSGPKILEMQELVRRVPASSFVIEYAVNLVRSSRPQEPQAPSFVKDWVDWGAGPRGSQHLILASKARAIMHGRYVASIEDVQAVAPSILRHRIICSFRAQAEGMSSLEIIGRLLEEIKPELDRA